MSCRFLFGRYRYFSPRYVNPESRRAYLKRDLAYGCSVHDACRYLPGAALKPHGNVVARSKQARRWQQVCDVRISSCLLAKFDICTRYLIQPGGDAILSMERLDDVGDFDKTIICGQMLFRIITNLENPRKTEKLKKKTPWRKLFGWILSTY